MPASFDPPAMESQHRARLGTQHLALFHCRYESILADDWRGHAEVKSSITSLSSPVVLPTQACWLDAALPFKLMANKLNEYSLNIVLFVL